MLLEIEAGQGLADQPDSLSDRVLEGLITRIRELITYIIARPSLISIMTR